MTREREDVIANAAALADSEGAAFVLDAVAAGIEAVHPGTVVREQVGLDGDELRVADATYDLSAYERVVVVGGGNAAGHVARTLEAVLGDRIDEGVVVTDDPADTSVVEVREGAHPVPDARALEGARAVRQRAEAAGPETLVLAVVTGGGSALLPAPAGDVTLADLRALTDELLRSGAAIDEVNAVRKHVSELKGGRLARAAAPARTVGLVFSDVASDDPAVVASGPLSPDSTTYGNAVAVLDAYDVDAPATVAEHLRAGAAGEVPESPGADDPAFERTTVHVLANGFTALAAAADVCEREGVTPLILSSSVRGEAREAAKTHVAVAEEVLDTGNPLEPPAAVLSGGETTVTVGEDGTGGPNQEFALAAALELPAEVLLASVDTDGVDGPTDAAGALVRRETARPAADARRALAENDVYPFLEEREALVVTGPTGTNVNDLRVVFVPG